MKYETIHYIDSPIKLTTSFDIKTGSKLKEEIPELPAGISNLIKSFKSRLS